MYFNNLLKFNYQIISIYILSTTIITSKDKPITMKSKF